MSWKRQGDQVTVTMSVADWELLLLVLGMAVGGARERAPACSILRLANRLNDGNPGFAPYAVESEAIPS